MYYSSEAYFRKRFNDEYKPFAFRADTQEEYERWKRDFRDLLTKLLGHDKMVSCPLNPQSVSIERMDGYTREKVIIDTEPGIKMPFYILKPYSAKQGEKLPAIIATHGHASNGKNAVCGIDKGNESLRKSIDDHNYDYGVQLVKQGFIVFCPDARGFGERAEKHQQNDEKLLDSSCSYLSAMAIPLGMNVTGMWTWDLMHLVDYVSTRDDVNADKINCAGLSGGGLQSLWLAAMDERIKNAIISGYFYGFNQSLLEACNCWCNYFPGLWENADVGDIGALISNRGVCIETGDKDGLNGRDGLDNVYPYVDVIKYAAKILNNESNILHHVFHGHHKWCGEKSIPWILERNFKE